MTTPCSLKASCARLEQRALSAFDFIVGKTLPEKLIRLTLNGPPAQLPARLSDEILCLSQAIRDASCAGMKAVVLGGGTGLSNIIGGDSRDPRWPKTPFCGLKQLIPSLTSVVCVTDDGGSTGELLKDLPLVALGDTRRVLLSSVQEELLRRYCRENTCTPASLVTVLHGVMNLRLDSPPYDPRTMLDLHVAAWRSLPRSLLSSLQQLLAPLAPDGPLSHLCRRRHCLGNLLLAAAVFLEETHEHVSLFPADDVFSPVAVMGGVRRLAEIVGAPANAVFPAGMTPARLQIRYDNGVKVTGEWKASVADRGFPVQRVVTAFSGTPRVPDGLLAAIRDADIIVLAPGSLFTSTIPVLQSPGIADAVRDNAGALKVLVANIWVQKGETDLAGPDRRYYISDLIRSYGANIPGGITGLVDYVLALGMRDIPGSILQRYAVEQKTPIFLDRKNLEEMGLVPLETNIYSQQALRERRVIQHDPNAVATALKTLLVADKAGLLEKKDIALPLGTAQKTFCFMERSDRRYGDMEKLVFSMPVEAGNGVDPEMIRSRAVDILWQHTDIARGHLDRLHGIALVPEDAWHRCQEWDNIFSFYDPEDSRIKIRHDKAKDAASFETLFLVALGQSLLGNYAAAKSVEEVYAGKDRVGKLFRLTLRPEEDLCSFFAVNDLRRYLMLCRMMPVDGDQSQFTRTVNGSEQFTPPGLFFGLTYAWYLDNRLASHIEYKMSILKNQVSELIPAQVLGFNRRRDMISFFRDRVFFRDVGSPSLA